MEEVFGLKEVETSYSTYPKMRFGNIVRNDNGTGSITFLSTNVETYQDGTVKESPLFESKLDFNPTNPDHIIAYNAIEKLWQESIADKI